MAQGFLADTIGREHAEGITLVTDPTRATYAALGARRDLAGVLHPRMLGAGWRSVRAGHSQGALAGDAMQLGGVIAVRPDGSVPYVHLERFAGDAPDVQAVLAALA
jgi:hypothetical protein